MMGWQKHEKKFKALKEMVDKKTLGDLLLELKTSFDFSGQVEMRVV